MKVLLSISIFLASWTISSGAQAQDSRRTDPNAIFKQSPSSRDAGPEKAETNSARKNKKISFSKLFNRRMDKKQEEFEERMEDNAKKYKKMARKMKKPQYSDPSYFGHKRKPKKRPVGKRKFCKECGIVH